MIDLTEITIPFGQLDAETQERLREHERLGGVILEGRHYDGYDYFARISDDFDPANGIVYRAKSNDIPASVDWSHIHTDYKHIRENISGEQKMFTETPVCERGFWRGKGDVYIGYNRCGGNLFASFRRGNMPWQDVILDRPE